MKKKILAAVFAATTMLIASAMTAFADIDVSYTFDSADELSDATITGAPIGADATVTEVKISEDGQLILDSTYGVLLPDKIDTSSYEISYTVTYNSVPSTAGSTVFVGEWNPEDWIGFGFGNSAYIGLWTNVSDGSFAWLGTLSDVTVEVGVAYDVKFQVKEGIVTVFVNDEEKATGSVPDISDDGRVYLGVTGWAADTVDLLLDNLTIKTISGLSEEEIESSIAASEEAYIAESQAASEAASLSQSRKAAQEATTGSTETEESSSNTATIIVVIVVIVVIIVIAAVVLSKKKKK